MKYPKYGAWCKQNVIETIRKQKINEEKVSGRISLRSKQ